MRWQLFNRWLSIASILSAACCAFIVPGRVRPGERALNDTFLGLAVLLALGAIAFGVGAIASADPRTRIRKSLKVAGWTIAAILAALLAPALGYA